MTDLEPRFFRGQGLRLILETKYLNRVNPKIYLQLDQSKLKLLKNQDLSRCIDWRLSIKIIIIF